MFGDAEGDSILIADKDDVAAKMRQVVQGKLGLTRERFWTGAWLGDAPYFNFKGYEALWSALSAEPREATVGIPRSSERQPVGRVKRLGKDWLLLESESGEYALIPAKDARKWRLE